jgi:hypothetical protein
MKEIVMSPTRYRLVPENELQQQPPEPPEPKYRFRWSVFVGVPLAIALALFVLNGIDPSFEFEDLTYKLGVLNQNRYVRLACLCVVCIAILLIVKLFWKNSEE